MTQNKIKKVIIVCASGVGSAKLLFYHLKKIFAHELEIVDSINYYELREYNLSSIDFIISTIPIKEPIGIPVQVVKTFLEEEDIDNIKSKIYLGPEHKTSLFLHHSRVFIHKEFDNKESVLRFMCEELYKQGLVPKNYINLVLEREAVASTGFGNLVAIPHPIKPVTEEAFWTICTLKQPILWENDQMVQFICLLNTPKEVKENLNNMYEKLIFVIEDKMFVEKIIKSDSVDEIINILDTGI
nr:PTS sugar transporter subunit IIA [Clostridium simiarum]